MGKKLIKIHKTCPVEIYLLLACAIFFSCRNSDHTGSISGKLTNASNKWVYFQQITDTGDVTIDSAFTDKAGNFQFEINVGEPDYYLLRTDDSNILFLVLRSGEDVEITGDARRLETTYTVKGSRDSELIHGLRSYERQLSDSLNAAYNALRQQDPQAADTAGPGMQQFYTEAMEEFARNLIRHNMKSIVSLSATKFLNQHSELSLMEELEQSLASEYPRNKYVNDYSRLMADLRKLPAGSEIPEITLPDPEGKMLSLSSLRGKVVLVDFWASWCGPCRQENPRLVSVYRKFSRDDFEIFGVSLDENSDAWKQAIFKDGLSWPQVSELKKWNSEVVSTFSIEAIPYNILVDRKGKIIAKGIRSGELEEKIAEAVRTPA